MPPQSDRLTLSACRRSRWRRRMRSVSSPIPRTSGTSALQMLLHILQNFPEDLSISYNLKTGDIRPTAVSYTVM